MLFSSLFSCNGLKITGNGRKCNKTIMKIMLQFLVSNIWVGISEKVGN